MRNTKTHTHTHKKKETQEKGIIKAVEWLSQGGGGGGSGGNKGIYDCLLMCAFIFVKK